jgi:hypothetical protein
MNDTTDDLPARSTRGQGVRVCTAAPAPAQPLRRRSNRPPRVCLRIKAIAQNRTAGTSSVRGGSRCDEYDLVVRFAALEQPVRVGGVL